MRIVFCLFIAVFYFSSCKKNNNTILDCEDTSIKDIALNNCAEKNASNGEPEICFIELQDSRCPANVVCVWEGVAIAKFSLKENSMQHQFQLSSKTSASFPPNDTLIAGYRIKLLDVLPYPGTGTQPVSAVLQITR